MLELLVLSAVVFVAAIVGTLTGFGTSTILVPVFLLILPLPITLLFVGTIHLAGDVWKMILFRGSFDRKLFIRFGITGILFSWLGAMISTNVSSIMLSQVLGIFLVFYALFLLTHRRWKLKPSQNSTLIGGAVSGFLAGLFGVGGAVRSAFLLAFKLKKSEFIFTAGAIAFVVDVVRISTYLWNGARLPSVLLLGLALFIPCSFLGSLVAKKIVHRVSSSQFRLLVAGFILLIGLRFFFFL